jgi:hypothetical protein
MCSTTATKNSIMLPCMLPCITCTQVMPLRCHLAGAATSSWRQSLSSEQARHAPAADSARKMRPAQVPHTGRDLATTKSRSASSIPVFSATCAMVVDSPPGMMRPSQLNRSARVRTSILSAPHLRKLHTCSLNEPCSASTPTLTILGRRVCQRLQYFGLRRSGALRHAPAHAAMQLLVCFLAASSYVSSMRWASGLSCIAMMSSRASSNKRVRR